MEVVVVAGVVEAGAGGVVVGDEGLDRKIIGGTRVRRRTVGNVVRRSLVFPRKRQILARNGLGQCMLACWRALFDQPLLFDDTTIMIGSRELEK
jgi:hypothetical protein